MVDRIRWGEMNDLLPVDVIQSLNKHKKIEKQNGNRNMFIYLIQGLLYHRTCKSDFLCSWPSLNSYLK